MKITRVLTAVNNNPKYTKFIPLFIESWKHTYPEIEPVIIFIGDHVPNEFVEYAQYIRCVPEIPGVSSVYVAQTIRLFYPCLLDENDVTIISDMDMIPTKSHYFNEDIPEGTFVVFRPLTCVGPYEIAMCYNAASTTVWRDIFGVRTLSDTIETLKKHYTYSDGIHGGKGWFQDQYILYAYTLRWNKNVKILSDDYTGYKRLDFIHHGYDITTFCSLYLKDTTCTDAHLYADQCKWSYDDIRTIIIKCFPRGS
jgi:hypothetical protein